MSILQREKELPKPKVNPITENNDQSRGAEDSQVPSRKYEDKFDEFQDDCRSADLSESRDLDKDTDLISSKPNETSSTVRFSVLEITFMSLAGVATTVLFLKFLVYDRFCRRNDRGEPILNQLDEYDRKDDHMGIISSARITSSRNGQDSGLAL